MTISRFIFTVAVLLRLVDASFAAEVTPAASVTNAPIGPLTPAQSLESLKVESGLRVELAAAEPLTVAPVAVTFDEKGRLYVVENRGYPVGPGPGKPPAGVIALLEDTDGDGLYDKRTVFADGLTFPNGITCWRGGVFVTCAPDVFYLKDTDGDGKADVRKVVLTGFSDANTTQLRVSHPTLGPDGWIYLTSGLTGGKVTSPEHPERPVVEFNKSDSRFNPDTLEFQTVAGAGQFGLTFDDFGRRFECINRNPLQHVVLETRYLKRNPFLALSDTVEDAAPSGDAGKVWPISPDTTTAGYIPVLMGSPHAGSFTSACGCMIYRGSHLNAAGIGFYGDSFVCEPAQNLVQRQIVSPNGASFRAKAAHPGSEFLASADTWFRPVFAAEGPDDAIYICDMYRKVIDHPVYLPDEVRATADFDAGKDRGRIWRILSERTARRELSRARRPKLDRAPTDQLCAALSDADGWVRSTVFRLLLERKDAFAVPALSSLVKHSGLRAESGVSALRLLSAMGSLDDNILIGALDASAPVLRENAILLAEPRLKDSAGLRTNVIARAYDPDPRVRFQCAVSLGEIPNPDPGIIWALATVAVRDGADRWTRAAVLSSIGGETEPFLKSVLTSPSPSPEAMAGLMIDFGRIYGASEPPQKCLNLIDTIISRPFEDWQMASVAGISEALQRRGIARNGRSALMTLIGGSAADAPRASVSEHFSPFVARAIQSARGSSASIESRVSAVKLLAQVDLSDASPVLLDLASPVQPVQLQAASVRAYGQAAGSGQCAALVTRERWRAYPSPVREATLDVMFAEPDRLSALFDAIERGDVQPWSLDPQRRKSLLRHPNEAIKKRAAGLFQGLGADRQKVFEEYKSVLTLPAIGKNGHEVFKRLCAQCHLCDGEGAAVGPDLSGIRNQPAEALLLHIIIPSHEIAPGFASWEIMTKDGKISSGLIASETERVVTLKRALGETEAILRSNIASMTSASLSLMPDELEKAMTRQEMADLIAYLKGDGR